MKKYDFLFKYLESEHGVELDESEKEGVENLLEKDLQLEKADQQLTGFFHRKDGSSLEDLVVSMGLKEGEWELLKSDFGLSYMSQRDRDEIDMIFRDREE